MRDAALAPLLATAGVAGGRQLPMSASGSVGPEKHTLRMLDLLRWGSAFVVAIGHVRNLLFLDYERIDHSSPFISLFYALTGLGHEAVMVFFVISGYLVGGGLILDGTSRQSLGDYFVHRFSRIYVVLVPALLLTAIFDFVGMSMFADLYRTPGWASALDFSAAARHDAAIFACNLANLQDAFCPNFGSNGPLWSLAYEWFYYLTFPALLAFATSALRNSIGAVAIGASLLAFGLLAWLFPSYSAYYPIWLMGAAARLIGTRRPLPRLFAYAGLALLPILLAVARTRALNGLVVDYLIGLALFVFFCNPRALASPMPFPAVHAKLADFSYSLYVVHFPLIVLLVAAMLGTGFIQSRLDPSASAFLLFAACLLVAYAMAWLFSLATERRTATVRRFISKCLIGLGLASVSGRTNPSPQPPSDREHPAPESLGGER